MKKASCLASFMMLLLLTGSVTAQDLRKSACRISSGGGIGTGLVIEVQDDTIWILSCAHNVPSGSSTVNVEFFTTGQPSHKVVARVFKIKRSSSSGDDFCALYAKKSDLGNYPIPPALPVAKRDYEIKRGEPIKWTGCTRGTMPNYTLHGHVWNFSKNSNKYFEFKPGPIPGDSGSGILNKDNELIGILYAYTTVNGDNKGLACSLYNIYHIMGWDN